MQSTHRPFFLLTTREILVLNGMIIGLALLLLYGGKAIAGVSSQEYLEGWHNRPFQAPKVINERPFNEFVGGSSYMYQDQASQAEPEASGTVNSKSTHPSDRRQNRSPAANSNLNQSSSKPGINANNLKTKPGL